MPVIISICIPAYKNAEFLQRLLDSISIQQFRDFEVIVADDSPDASVSDCCDRYRDRFRLTYHRSVPALGTPENWNEAIRMAKGDWIKLMHDDDWFAREDSLGKFADSAMANPTASFIFSAFCNVDIGEGISGHPRENIPKNASRGVFIRPFRYKALCKNPVTLFSLNGIGPPSVTLHRNDRLSYYDPTLKWLVDIDFYIRRLATDKPVYIAQTLINVGISGQQLTRDLFHYRPVEIPESFALLHKTGVVNLKSLLIYDAWWRMMRNLEIRGENDIQNAGYSGEIPQVILSMVAWQQKMPSVLIKTGVFSKTLMFLHYLFHRNKM